MVNEDNSTTTSPDGAPSRPGLGRPPTAAGPSVVSPQGPEPASAKTLDHRFPPAVRLHSNRDYGRVFHRQQKAAGKWCVVLLCPRKGNPPPPARLGIMIPAKVVKTAVRRHQLKRWLRELFRLRLKEVLAGHDCVVLLRSDVADDPAMRLRFDQEACGLIRQALAATATPGRRGGRPNKGKR